MEKDGSQSTDIKEDGGQNGFQKQGNENEIKRKILQENGVIQNN